MHERIVVVAGGDRERIPFSSLGHFDFCIAADGGLMRAQDLKLRADLVIGDMDSVSEEALQRARDDDAEVEIHSTEKDANDLELALEAAFARTPTEVVVVGGGGGRVDQSLVTFALIAAFAARNGPRVSGVVGGWSVTVASSEQPWQGIGKPGDLVSLLPVGSDAAGVVQPRTSVLRWTDETLQWGSSRGLSNTFITDSASVSLTSGTLLVLRPLKEGTPMTCSLIRHAHLTGLSARATSALACCGFGGGLSC